MIPAPFELSRPTTVAEAIRALTERGDDAKVLAGGQSLIPLMKLRFALPAVLVDIGGIEGLGYIREEGDRIAIGALTRHAEIERSELLESRCRLLVQAASEVGDIQVRNRGTIGGSLAHADPNADLPTAVLALGAELVAEGPHGRRTIPAREFFVDRLTSALAADEILIEVRVPQLHGAGSSYLKFNRRAQDWAIVACAAIVREGNETIAWGGVAPTPVLAEADWRRSAESLRPTADLSGSSEYKRALAELLAERALEKASS